MPLQRSKSSLVENASPVSAAYADNSGNNLFLELTKSDTHRVTSYRFEPLKGCVWIGHTNTDMDSIGSAIGGALLFQGTAARASEELNGETKFVLKYFGLEEPPLFKTLSKEQRSRVCLVDHNQITQMAEGVEQKFVRGVFDHHALQKNTVCTDTPIIIDIKPWGSTCTMIARQFWKERCSIPKPIAGVLLAGILSDTLNLRSPTTTEVDKVMVSMLSRCAGFNEEEINAFAMEMFKAKAEAFNELSTYALILGDHKEFSLTDFDKDPIKLGFGVVETTHPDEILKRKTELIQELRAIRKEKKLDFSYLAIVDTLKLESILLLCGPSEAKLASMAFEGSTFIDRDVLNLGSRVSRKLDFIPALDACLQVNNIELGKLSRQETEDDLTKDFGVVVVGHGDHGEHCGSCCMPRRKLPKLKSVVTGVTFANRLNKAIQPVTGETENFSSALMVKRSSLFAVLLVGAAVALSAVMNRNPK